MTPASLNALNSPAQIMEPQNENPILAAVTIPAATGSEPDNSADQERARIQRASADAVREHAAANPPKRGRGRPPGRTVPVAGVDAPAAAPLVFELPPAAPQPPAIDPNDEKAIEALVDGILEGMNDFVSGLQRTIALQKSASKTVADEAFKSAHMSESAQRNMRIGGVALVKKYLREYAQYTPEACFLIPFGFWLGGNVIAAKRPYEQPQPNLPNLQFNE